MRERFGPRRPPLPSMRWQLRHPLSWKSRAPSATGPLVAPTTSAVQRRRVEVRRPRRPRAHDPERADHQHRHDDDADRPRAPPRAPLALVREERRREEQRRRRASGAPRMTTCLEARRAEREHGEVPEQVPVGPRVGVGEARVGRRVERRRPDEPREQDDAADHRERRRRRRATPRPARRARRPSSRSSSYFFRYVFGSTGSPGVGGSEMPWRITRQQVERRGTRRSSPG